MGILRLFKKKVKPVTRTFLNSPGFWGYKRMTISNFGDDEAQKTIGLLAIKNKKYKTDKAQPMYIFDLEDKEITLDPVVIERQLCLRVLVNGGRIGTVFPDRDNYGSYFDSIFSGQVQSVHVRIEYDNTNVRANTYLFIKL